MYGSKIHRLIITLLTTAVSIGTNTTFTLATQPESIAHKQLNLSTSKPKSLAKPLPRGIANFIALAKKSKKPAQANKSPIRVIYRDTKSEDVMTQAVLQAFRQEKLLETFSELITVQLRLPRKVTFVMEDCGVANAFYNPENHSVTICHELTSSLVKTFVKSGLTEEEAIEPVIYTIAFTMYHEIGHMLIHELNLPITGREEDVADQFSAHVFLDWMNVDPKTAELGEKIVQAAFQWFGANEDDLGDLTTFMDEHSLNKQRALSLLCMLYVKNPDLYAKAVIKLGFEPNRLAKCRQESAQINKSWDALLAPYSKR